MRLFGTLFSGKEGLTSHSKAMSVVADNITNSNTTAYKSKRAEFSNLLCDGEGSLYSFSDAVGNGSSVPTISTSHEVQGALDQTGRELDLAIAGRGFFVVTDGDTDYYTRSGNFVADAEGNITTSTGDVLLGYTEDSPTNAVPLNVRSQLANAKATTSIQLGGNLDVTTPIIQPPAAPADFAELSEASSFQSPVRVIDSLGQEHDVQLHCFHTDDLGWEVRAYVNASEVGGEEGKPELLATGQINFQPDGTQANGEGLSLDIAPAWANGSEPGAASIDLSSLGSLAMDSSFDTPVSDGLRAGTLLGVSVERDGSIMAKLDTGDEVKVGSVALANFRNPDGLESVGDNKFLANEKAGAPDVGVPDTDGRGKIEGETLEVSTVDLATEMVDLIRLQRGYQAGSSVVKNANDLLQSTIQIA